MLFPSIFLFFPHTVAVFILAMAVWGVYFELMVFAESYFIEAAIPAKHHALACGVLNSFKSLSFLLAPLFVPYLIDQGIQIPLYTAMVMLHFSLSAILRSRSSSQITKNIIPKH